jgi:hypothetical protein
LEEKKGIEDEGETEDSSTDVMNRLLGQRQTISKKRGITEVEEGSTDASVDEGESSSEDSEDSTSESSFEDDDSSASSDEEQSE